MTIIISHRRNKISELKQTPLKYGIEVDIRSKGLNLIVNHDPFVEGVLFEDWLNSYQHKILILNVKEEGLEERLILLMRQKGIFDYFFLDQSFPYLLKSAKSGERRCAARVSEFESIQTALSLSGKIDWIWVDYFTHFPLNHTQTLQLRQAGFRLCLVSPELQAHNAETEIPILIKLLQAQNIQADAVCTKRPDLWEYYA